MKGSKNRIFDFQIPDSPPDYRTLSKDKVQFLLFDRKIITFSRVRNFFECNPECNQNLLRFRQGCDQRIHPRCAFSLHLVAGIGVGLQCKRSSIVTEVSLHRLDVVAVFQ